MSSSTQTTTGTSTPQTSTLAGPSTSTQTTTLAGTSTSNDIRLGAWSNVIKDMYYIYYTDNFNPDTPGVPGRDILSFKEFKDLAGEKCECTICKETMLTEGRMNHPDAIRFDEVLTYPNDDKEIFFSSSSLQHV